MEPTFFSAAIVEHYRSLWLFAVSLCGNRHDADDVTQQACLVAASKLNEFRQGSNFRAWMFQIVRLTSMNHVRTRSKWTRQTATSTLLPGISTPTDEAVVSGTSEPFDDECLAALEELAPQAKACLLLKVVEGLSYTEIATALEIAEGTAMSHVHRSKVYLRERLQTRKGDTR